VGQGSGRFRESSAFSAATSTWYLGTHNPLNPISAQQKIGTGIGLFRDALASDAR
jgi:hypothetical protein